MRPGFSGAVLGLAGILALVISVAAAGPTLEKKLVSVWPPLALALAFELLLQMRE